MNKRLTITLLAACALAACDHNRNQSVEPGTNDPGAGAGQRGGVNDGAAAGNTRSSPGYPGAATGQVTPPPKR
jgi:hypothetical protein